jgi:hypothetical protein
MGFGISIIVIRKCPCGEMCRCHIATTTNATATTATPKQHNRKNHMVLASRAPKVAVVIGSTQQQGGGGGGGGAPGGGVGNTVVVPTRAFVCTTMPIEIRIGTPYNVSGVSIFDRLCYDAQEESMAAATHPILIPTPGGNSSSRTGK